MKEVGFVSSNPVNVRILELLRKKEADIETISKLTRIPLPTLRVAMKGLKERGLVVEVEGKFRISEEGLEVLKRL